MNILVTGGLGYVGSHLCGRLSENNNITILDNFSNSLNHIKEQKNVKIVYGDIRDKKIVDNIVSNADTIIHTAAQTSVTKSLEYPAYDTDNNINGTLNLLEAARRSDMERFIYISSAAVYGIPTYLPVDEKHITNPVSPYGLSKLTGPVTCIHPFNIFGPGQMKNSYSGVIYKVYGKCKNW